MPELVVPCLSLAASVRAAARTYGDDHHPSYREAVTDRTDEGLAAYVAELLADTQEAAPRAPGLVPSTHLWWVEGETYLGRVHIRHRLTPFLLDVDGHLGYHVIPPYRRRGHATAMLAAALPFAAAAGIRSVLVTCDADNVGSRKVIEANGGRFEDQRGTKLRFWIAS